MEHLKEGCVVKVISEEIPVLTGRIGVVACILDHIDKEYAVMFNRSDPPITLSFHRNELEIVEDAS